MYVDTAIIYSYVPTALCHSTYLLYSKMTVFLLTPLMGYALSVLLNFIYLLSFLSGSCVFGI